MTMAQYLSTPAWSELVVENVYGRPTKVWRERPRHVLDLFDLARANPQQDLLVHGERRVSFGAFRDAVESGAAELSKLGVSAGDRVLVVLYNSAEFLLAQWSAWRVGAIPVLGNRWWNQRELVDVMGRAKPSLLITDMPVPMLTTDSGVASTASITPEVVATWWALQRPAAPVPDPRGAVGEDDVAIMVFTAGSSGAPKAVQLSHRNLVWTQQTLHVMRGGRPPVPASAADQKVALMTTPMFHNGAVVSGLSAYLEGNRIVILRGRFNPEEVLQLIQRERVSSWQAVPTMFNRVLQHPNFGTYDLSSLVGPSTGGTMVPSQLVDAIKAKLPGGAKGFALGYGMTEMSFISMALTAHLDQKPGTVGKPIPGVEMKVTQPDASGEGELLARSGALMVGYLGAEEQPIDEDGWYHTGDLGRIDADGFLFVTGRSKDMVIRGGENIACPHVEAAIMAHPDVLEVAVVGYPDDEFGEAVAAIVYLRPGSNLSQEELRLFAKDNLAYFEVPTRWLFRSEALPVLPTGKIDKRSLGRDLASEVAASRG